MRLVAAQGKGSLYGLGLARFKSQSGISGGLAGEVIENIISEDRLIYSGESKSSVVMDKLSAVCGREIAGQLEFFTRAGCGESGVLLKGECAIDSEVCSRGIQNPACGRRFLFGHPDIGECMRAAGSQE